MSKMETFITGFLVAALITVILYGFAWHPKIEKLNRLEERQTERNKVELSKSGGGILYIPEGWKEKYFNYNLRSFDGGKTWYAIEYDKDENLPVWGFRILGEVDTLYPGLMEHINGWDALTDYVEKHGAIDGTDPAGIRALEDAGFTVKTVE